MSSIFLKDTNYNNEIQLKVSQQNSEKIILRFPDNRKVSVLFGKFNENLALIEDQLGVLATARGNVLELSGSQKKLDCAQYLLKHFYTSLDSKSTIDYDDMVGALRLALDTVPDTEKTSPKIQMNPLLAVINTKRKNVQARSLIQSRYIQAMEYSKLVFGIGPAGTGKTYLAVAYAISLLEKGCVSRVILSRPAVEAGEKLGFLPGDMKEKIDPYLRPIYDALYDLIAAEKVYRYIETGVIEIAPLAFMRGRTLSNAAIILDEAQNVTSMQMKMFLTRFGEHSKMIVAGDPSQIDLLPGQTSGLTEAAHLLESINGIMHIQFSFKDVVRHQLVSDIVNAYDNKVHK